MATKLPVLKKQQLIEKLSGKIMALPGAEELVKPEELLLILQNTTVKKMMRLQEVIGRTTLVRKEDLSIDALMDVCLRMAAHCYGDLEDSILPQGWRVVEHTIDKESGLNASVYYSEDVDRYVCAFAGSAEIVDWKENFKQLEGSSVQYDLAVEFAQKCVNAYGAAKLLFTGHSQGGGEAALSAFKFNCPAVTFNPAGISDQTIQKHEISSQNNALVTAYVYWNDILFLSQMLIEMFYSTKVDPNGRVLLMVDKKAGTNIIKEWHGLDGFLKYMDIGYTPLSK